MNRPRVLVAGIGNIFLGDDAFGVEVAQRLLALELPEGIRVVDFGIRGLDLAYALLDNYETVILVDAVPRGEPPGTLYVIEPQLPDESPGELTMNEMLDLHDLDPVKVMRLVRAQGGHVRNVLLVGCEPQPIADDEFMPGGLSEPVRSAVEPAVERVLALARERLPTPAQPVGG